MPVGTPHKVTDGYEYVRDNPDRTFSCAHDDCIQGAVEYPSRASVADHARKRHLKSTGNSKWCYRCNFHLHEKTSRLKGMFEQHVEAHVPVPEWERCEDCEAVWYKTEGVIRARHLFVKDTDKNLCPACENGAEHLEGRTWNPVTHDYDYANEVAKESVWWPSEDLLARISNSRRRTAPSGSRPPSVPIQPAIPAARTPREPGFYPLHRALQAGGFYSSGQNLPHERLLTRDQRHKKRLAALLEKTRNHPPNEQHSLAITPTRLSRRQTLVYGQSFAT